ncbi:hypothetical protein HPB49_013396 [Dermacentor silvarum]|uniref:Uncharacterized protein n=1 Tax=Dermacentor silvarum TaxID=543639 RepID=A0ACB8C9I3_DERSI|nr:hypothetical protein HPB49_013396 [Dermacentor silvarum]
MERVHLVPSDDDDLYSGYNEFDPSLDIDGLTRDEGIQNGARTSYGRRPPACLQGREQHGGPQEQAETQPPLEMPQEQLVAQGSLGTGTSFRGQTSVVPPSRLNTAATSFASRPMTAVRGAGYSSAAVQGPVGSAFDPLAQAKTSIPSFGSSKESSSPEERLKQLEGAVMELVEQSSISASKQQYKLALDQAKDAVAKERNLSRQREQAASEVPPNLDLMYCALFNLAVQYTNNQMYTEALSTYQLIVKNKAFSNAVGGGADKVRRSFLKLLDVAPEQIDEFDKYEPSQGDPAEMLYYEEIKNDSLQQIERESHLEHVHCILLD